MQQLFIREKGSAPIFMALHGSDVEELNLEHDIYGQIYFSGKIIFLGQDYDYMLLQKNAGVLEMELSFGSSSSVRGLISMEGDWSYKNRWASLQVTRDTIYEEFQRLINIERKITWSEVNYRFSVWSFTRYATEGYVPDNYELCSDLPLEWSPTTEYSSAQQISPGVWIGEDENTIRDTGVAGQTYFSIKSNNIGHDPLDEPDPENNPVWWYLPSSTKTYKQLRSRFKFDVDAIYNTIADYFALGACSGAGFYDQIVRGFNIKTELNILLEDSGFEVDTNWLNYAKNIDSAYAEPYYLDLSDISSAANAKVIKIDDLIKIIETLYNCEYRLTSDYKLTFKHQSELITFEGYVPPEHMFTNRNDITLFKNENRKVFEHRLNFSKSDLNTHNDSVILYANSFKDSNTISSQFEVDFEYFMRTESGNCVVTVYDISGQPFVKSDVLVFNPLFIPAIIHERFYLVDREFESGELNGVQVPLVLSYKESASFEAGSELDINNFNFNYNCLLDFGLGRFKSISFNLQSNKYKLEVAIQKPYS